MADIREIIHTIMSDPKIAASGNFSPRVYHDEPILIPARQMERFTPPQIREMRKLAKTNGSDAKVFYEQGRFMESFDDDFSYAGEYVQYFPTYQAMTDAQLRGYFSWRSGLRRGTVERTSLSFAFVHIYELLNGIGVDTPEDGFHALKDFWTAYREFDSRIDSYVAVWLKDYVIYHNLDNALLAGLPDIDADAAVDVLLDYASHSADEVFAALDSLSSYDLANSKFRKLYPDDVAAVVCRVFAAVSEYYNKNPRQSAREKLFGRMCVNPYAMFKSAVFYPRVRQEDRVHAVGPWHKYICKDGVWSCERFVWYGRNNKRIGALLKTVDYLMRRRYGYKSTLQPGKTNKILTGKIEKIIAQYEQDKRDNAPREIAIDVSRLHAIRAAARITQEKLLIEEEEPEPIAPPVEETAARNGFGLADHERRLLIRLAHGVDDGEPAAPRGVMLSVLVDRINEKLFDVFNDTVIADAGDGPELIEDYREEVKGMFPQ